MRVVKPVQNLIDEFRKLPTIGPKTAGRLVYFLLRAPEEDSLSLAEAVVNLKRNTIVCQTCFNIAEKNPCVICADDTRQHQQICVVEEPLDVLAIEGTGRFNGVYFVLGGTIDPLRGIGPEEIRIGELMKRLGSSVVEELILATNPSVEGEATAMYIKKQVQAVKLKGQNLENLKVTRLARGLPTGGDLEYADKTTLSRALEGRQVF